MPVTLETLTDQLALADELGSGRHRMFDPQDLPGRFGRVIRAVDHLLEVTAAEAVLAGGWAVWRHGYLGRVTQDVDVLLPEQKVAEFLRAAAVAGFDVLPTEAGRWPKMIHRETGIKVDVLPEGARPGTVSHPAPTALPHPGTLGAAGTKLRYISLPGLVHLKLAAGRARDESDIIELIRANPDAIGTIRRHLAAVHADYVTAFEWLVERAREQHDA